MIERRLPRGWQLKFAPEPSTGQGLIPATIVVLVAPDGAQATFVAEVKRRITSTDIVKILDQISRNMSPAIGVALPLVVAPYLAKRTRDALAERQTSYADATGNMSLVADRPGLWVMSVGATSDPEAAALRSNSLKGARSARGVRALVEFRPPFGIRELAERASVSAPTLSRVTALLEREDLIERDDRGTVMAVDWQDALRRWSQDYALRSSNRLLPCLDPRGVGTFTERLSGSDVAYAATGAFAAERLIPFAPARTATIYVPDAEIARERLSLRPADTGGNVILVEPFDPVVFERTSERDGLTCANPAQIVVDLLTGPGREPSSAEELLKWMERNVDAWRS